MQALKLSNKITDAERHYLNNIIQSGQAEAPDKKGKVSPDASYILTIEDGFVVGAKKILKLKQIKD